MDLSRCKSNKLAKSYNTLNKNFPKISKIHAFEQLFINGNFETFKSLVKGPRLKLCNSQWPDLE